MNGTQDLIPKANSVSNLFLRLSCSEWEPKSEPEPKAKPEPKPESKPEPESLPEPELGLVLRGSPSNSRNRRLSQQQKKSAEGKTDSPSDVACDYIESFRSKEMCDRDDEIALKETRKWNSSGREEEIAEDQDVAEDLAGNVVRLIHEAIVTHQVRYFSRIQKLEAENAAKQREIDKLLAACKQTQKAQSYE